MVRKAGFRQSYGMMRLATGMGLCPAIIPKIGSITANPKHKFIYTKYYTRRAIHKTHSSDIT